MHKLFWSKRDLPLFTAEVREDFEKPVLTLENYTKWYTFFLVYPNGKVEEIDYDEVTDAMDDVEELGFCAKVDHVWNPLVMERIAQVNNYLVCEQAHECLTGRWYIEVKNHDLLLHNTKYHKED